jgi:hypothetical protein
MRKKYFVSFEKFKKLYFYKFVFIQIWFAFSLIELFTIVFILPEQLVELLFHSSLVYFIFIPFGISGILWFYSLGWYLEKKHISENSFIIINGGNIVFKTQKQIIDFNPRKSVYYHDYIYTINNISNIHIDKHNITIYGGITMVRRRGFPPKAIIAEKHYTKIKIPNIFERLCIDAMQKANKEKY